MAPPAAPELKVVRVPSYTPVVDPAGTYGRDDLEQLLVELLSDRPGPLRRYDQIHMRIADLAEHIRRIAPSFAGKDVLVMGDSDGLVVGLACAGRLGLVEAPRKLYLCDFDRRVLQFVNKTVRRLGLDDLVTTTAYNVFEPLPYNLVGSADAFHTNPPYGQFNNGRSVSAFVERCLAGVRPDALGVVIAANDGDFPWTQVVLKSILGRLAERDVVAFKIEEQCHRYDLDDQPELRSGTIWCRLLPGATPAYLHDDLPSDFSERFYGRETIPIPRYISLDGVAEQLVLINDSDER